MIIILILYKQCNLQSRITFVIFSQIFTNQQINTVPVPTFNYNPNIIKNYSAYYIRFAMERLKTHVRIPSAPARCVTPTPATGGSELRVDRL